MTLRRALFLSGSLGKGHDTLAEACASALTQLGVESRIVDCMPMLGRGLGGVGDRVFRSMLAVTPVFDAFHFSQLRGDGRLGRLSDRAAVRAMLPQLREEVRRFGPDLVVSVFATGAAGAAALRREGGDFRTVVFMTDSFAHRIWVHPGTDLFLVTSDLAAASVWRYWPEAEVKVVDAPVRPEFHAAPSRRSARSTLGIDQSARCVLLMSGGWGIGPLADVAGALGRAGFVVLAVAGDNQKLKTTLEDVAGRVPNVVPFGYTERIPDLMAAADVVMTSSGDTCREARSIGRPLVLLDVVPGHGRENLNHELELGNALVSSLSPETAVGVVGRALGLSGEPPPVPSGWGEDFVSAVRTLGLPLGQPDPVPAPRVDETARR